MLDSCSIITSVGHQLQRKRMRKRSVKNIYSKISEKIAQHTLQHKQQRTVQFIESRLCSDWKI